MDLTTAIKDIGFPAAVAAFVLLRLEGRLAEVRDEVRNLREVLYEVIRRSPHVETLLSSSVGRSVRSSGDEGSRLHAPRSTLHAPRSTLTASPSSGRASDFSSSDEEVNE